MNRLLITATILASIILAGCSDSHPAPRRPTPPPGRRPSRVRTAQSVTRNVAAGFQQTGSFVADETSDIAPLVAGRVISTPVNVGDFVKQGQVICELEHRDAQLRLDQAKAALEQATAALRQTESRIGFSGTAPRAPSNPATASKDRTEPSRFCIHVLLLFASFAFNFGQGLWGILEILVYVPLWLVVLRIVAEIVLVFFKAHEAAAALVTRNRGRTTLTEDVAASSTTGSASTSRRRSPTASRSPSCGRSGRPTSPSPTTRGRRSASRR